MIFKFYVYVTQTCLCYFITINRRYQIVVDVKFYIIKIYTPRSRITHWLLQNKRGPFSNITLSIELPPIQPSGLIWVANND